MKTIIHVSQHVIKDNLKRQVDNPAIIVKTYKGSRLARSVEILGPSKLIHNQTCPLSGCGARVWIETKAEVVIQ